MPRRRPQAELDEAREGFLAAREEVTSRYTGGESAAFLSRSFGNVGERWVAERLDEWEIPRRNRSSAAVVRGPGVPPLSKGTKP